MDKCQEVFEHGAMAKEKPDKTELLHPVLSYQRKECQNAQTPGGVCWEHMFYRRAPQKEHVDRTYDAPNHLTYWVKFHPPKQPYAVKH